MVGCVPPLASLVVDHSITRVQLARDPFLQFPPFARIKRCSSQRGLLIVLDNRLKCTPHRSLLNSSWDNECLQFRF